MILKTRKILLFLHSLENWILFFLVIGMLSLSVTQIFLRNLFDFGLVWSEALTRLMVLWTTMIGSMVAARSALHIRIDLLDQYAPQSFKKWLIPMIHISTASICMTLLYYSLQFLHFEYLDGTLAFANIPSWVFISILPFGFMVMSMRYLLKAFL